MTTAEMVRELCKKQNISLAELARRLQQTPQNFFKKIKRESLSLEELKDIADIFGVRYEQMYVLENGDYVSTANEFCCKNSKQRSKTDVKAKFLKILDGLGETVVKAIEEHYSVVVENAVDRERDFGIQKMVESLLDLKVEDEKIISSLGKYWEMNTQEAVEAVKIIKTIVHPKNKLKHYMKVEGYTDVEIRKFITMYYVGPELRNNHELWKLSPAELKRYCVDKRQQNV